MRGEGTCPGLDLGLDLGLGQGGVIRLKKSLISEQDGNDQLLGVPVLQLLTYKLQSVNSRIRSLQLRLQPKLQVARRQN